VSGVIVGRRGERIVLSEYPADHAERLNRALNGIVGEDVERPEVVARSRRPRGFRFPPALTWGLGVTGVVVALVLGLFHSAPSAGIPSPSPSMVTDVQLPTLVQP